MQNIHTCLHMPRLQKCLFALFCICSPVILYGFFPFAFSYLHSYVPGEDGEPVPTLDHRKRTGD